jgi:hypothetical protein
MTKPKNAPETDTNPWDALGITTLPMGNVKTALDILWGMDKKITPCLVGDTGIGKTPIVIEWTDERGGYLYELNFGHMTPEQVSMMMFAEDLSSYDFVAPKWFLDLNEQAELRGMAVLFVDEWNRGDKQLVNALFTLMDGRRMYNLNLHPNVLIIAAMNPSNGQYLVNEAEKDPAIRKRLNFMYTTLDHAAWVQHATAASFHPRVIEFIRAQPTALYDIAARDAGKAFPCPANWEKVSNILYSAERLKKMTHGALRSLLSGQIGHAMAEVFVGYLEDQNTIIGAEAVLEHYNPTGRARVARLLGGRIDAKGVMQHERSSPVRTDVLNTLGEGICTVLFSARPAPLSVAENLSQYLIDLPDEFFQSFLTVSLNKHAKGASDGREYLQRLNLALQSLPAFSERVRRMVDNQTAISASLRS